mmetsp:Transcript_2885/g.7138  ORF Transcript_2885/g.7138 Transcript_2885/m.7138 type:complete len:239 (-) Transcript_2885:533-1249(-)
MGAHEDDDFDSDDCSSEYSDSDRGEDASEREEEQAKAGPGPSSTRQAFLDQFYRDRLIQHSQHRLKVGTRRKYASARKKFVAYLEDNGADPMEPFNILKATQFWIDWFDVKAAALAQGGKAPKQHEVDGMNAAMQKWFKEDRQLYPDQYSVPDLQHDAAYRQAYQNAQGLTKGGDKWERRPHEDPQRNVSQQSYKSHEWPVLCGNLHMGRVDVAKRQAGEEVATRAAREDLTRASRLL